MNAPIPSLPESWRQHLTALPEVDPPDALWIRLQAAALPAQAPRSARNRWPWAVAAAAGLAAVLAWPQPDPTVDPALSHTPPVVDQNLRLLDQELTLAYARRADDAELAALWQTRERLLQGAAESDPPLLVRL